MSFISRSRLPVYLPFTAARVAASLLLAGVVACTAADDHGAGETVGPDATVATPSEDTEAAASPDTATATPYNLGINAPSVSYYNDAPMYSDVAHQMCGNNGRWDRLSNDAAAPVDDTGAPTVPAWTGYTLDYPTGSYTLSWDGKGSISMPGMGKPTVTTVDGVQHNVATVSVVQNPSGEAWQYVTADPPVTNIHFLVPAANQVAGSVFTKDFYARMKPFTNVRFMDALATNGNRTESWSQRTWPSEGSRCGTLGGMAWEDIVDFANHAGKDVWINIPGLATDDYVCRVARLFVYGEPGDKSNAHCDLTAPSDAPKGAVALNTRSKVHLEYSNEVWNWGFQQTTDLYCMANGAPPSGGTCSVTKPTSALAAAALADKSLGWSGAANRWWNGTELSVFMAKRTGDIFKTVFGARRTQIKTVMNVQSAWAAEVDPGFAFMDKAFGALTGYLDYMAVAPYAGLDDDKYAASVADIFGDLPKVLLPSDDSGNSIYNWIVGDLAEANEYGLSLVAYEGGQGLNGYGIENECTSIKDGVGSPKGCNTALPLQSTIANNENAAQSDARMFSFYQSYFAVWDKLVGRSHLFNAYTSVGGDVWGSLTSLEDPGSQKWDALLTLRLTPGDANGDGAVNGTDCAIVRASWDKKDPWWSEGNFNHDGTVDAEDLAILNAHISGAKCVAP